MSQYRIIEVTGKKDIRKFIKFPDILYKDCPQYVPALHSDQMKSLTSVPTLSYCKRKLWMVLDEKGNVAGRICGMINPRYNERYSTKRARFGWFDVIDDFEVAKLLISTAQEWAKSEGMNEIHGPLYYNTLGKQGMLVEGFENIPPFNCLYNYPYYNDFMDKLGFVKECDWIQYKMPCHQPLPDKVTRIAGLLKERYNLHEGSIETLKKDKNMVRHFFDVYNRSFSDAVYNFVPFTDEEIEEEASSVMPYLNDKTSVVVMDENNSLVAFSICFPCLSFALQKAKGKLFPFGWYHLLKAIRKPVYLDLMLNGAAPEWQNKGVSSIFHVATSRNSLQYGYQYCVSNPQIETNSAANIWTSYNNEFYMRRRCYIKSI